jgi:hypothetical protein
MVETFQSNKIAKGADNIAGLTNIEAIAVDNRYFKVVDDFAKWSPGVRIKRGDGNLQAQGFQNTTWTSGAITHRQWYYLKTQLLRGAESGAVTIQTRKYDEDRWVIANAILDIGTPSTLTKVLHHYRPFVWRFSRIKILEEQRMYGAIYTKDASTAQADITTTPVLLTGFSAVEAASSGVTASHTADSLTVGYGGIWEFKFHIDATGTASQQFKFNIRVNAVEGVYQCEYTTNATPDQISTSMSGLLDLDADDVLTIYVETDDVDAGTNLTPVNMQFSVTSVSLDE